PSQGDETQAKRRARLARLALLLRLEQLCGLVQLAALLERLGQMHGQSEAVVRPGTRGRRRLPQQGDRLVRRALLGDQAARVERQRFVRIEPPGLCETEIGLAL